MLKNIKIYTSDKYWNGILTDLGCCVVDSPNASDVIFDDIKIKTPISIRDLQKTILSHFENDDVIRAVFGDDVVLSRLARKIIVTLYKNPYISMSELKQFLGVTPDLTTHAVENVIYQLRKTYGSDIIKNENGKYKIGRI